MTYSIRPARRSEAKPLIGLYSESGCGKTWSALLLARGFVGSTGKIVQIETESGRGEAYADLLPGGYEVVSMRDDFSPVNYGEAISAAEKADADALIIDSGSHEWEAVGGVLSMAAKNEADGKKGVLVWQVPKLEHSRHFVLRLLSTPIRLVIICMRARYPMQEDKARKQWMRSDHLVPYQADNFLFELFAHGWIDREHRFHGTKFTRDDLRQVLRDNEPITLDTGQRLAAWARGDVPVVSATAASSHAPAAPEAPGPRSGAPEEETSAGSPREFRHEPYPPKGTLVSSLPRTPVDDWTDQFDNVKTANQRKALLARVGQDWGTFLAPEQKRLADANKRAQARVGG